MKLISKDGDSAIVELETGERVAVPSKVIPQAAEPGAAFQLTSQVNRKGDSPGGPNRRRADRAKQAVQFFIEKGWAPHQAFGIVGNLMQESGRDLNPTAVGDSGTAFGIAQVRHDRFASLKALAKEKGTNWQDFRTQLEHVNWELHNTERAAGSALRRAGTVAEATDAMIGFERPAGWKAGDPSGAHGRGSRMKYAHQLAGIYQPNGSGVPDFEMSRAATAGTAQDGRSRSAADDPLTALIKRSAAARGGDKPTLGGTLKDVLSGALSGLGAGSGGEITLPDGPDIGRQQELFSQIAQNGPLPRLGSGIMNFLGS